MSLIDLLDLSLVGRREKPAVEFKDSRGLAQSLTFGQIESRSNQWARLFAARGLRPGDRLAFYLANRIEIVDLWLGALKAGVVVVPINVLYREREIRHILADAKPAAVVTTAAQAGDFAQAAAVWDVEALGAEAAGFPAGRPEGPILGADAPLSLVYTSGTTGTAKGAILTQGNFVANTLALTVAWAITAEDRYLATLPLFHVHGLGNGLHCWLASGCHMKLTERFEQGAAAEWFESYRPTLFFGVPTMYIRLLELPEERAKSIGRGVRLFVCGSAPLPAQVLEAFRQRFGHVILERYGMTETLMNVSNPYAGERRAGTVGRPLPHVAVKILDEAGAPVPEGTTGELWVQGPNVCAGYWQRPDATAAAWRDGWFRTGDLGTRARDGYITLQGRRSDLIISGGFNIYPREIEEVLLEQPGVREAAVVGAPDGVRGEVPLAYVVAGPEFDEAAVQARLRTQLASFKLPRALLRVPALPRTALGKVQKHLLPAWKRDSS